jgi:hypothetical protein
MIHRELLGRRASSRACLLTRVALLVLIAAALVVTGGHIAHVHAAETAGLYNEQHVFESTSWRSGEAPVPSAIATHAFATVVVTATPPAPGAPATPALRRADPRAPPSA